MRVALADDSALFRNGLELLLRASGVQVTSQASSGDELMANIVPDPPDAVVLDLRMPPTYTGEGIETAAAIRAWDPGVGILVLSTYAEASYAGMLIDAVGHGVGYLLKDNVTDAGNLVAALQRIAAGETVIDPAVVRRLLQRRRISGPSTRSTRANGRCSAGWPRAAPTWASPRTCSCPRAPSRPT